MNAYLKRTRIGLFYHYRGGESWENDIRNNPNILRTHQFIVPGEPGHPDPCPHCGQRNPGDDLTALERSLIDFLTGLYHTLYSSGGVDTDDLQTFLDELTGDPRGGVYIRNNNLL